MIEPLPPRFSATLLGAVLAVLVLTVAINIAADPNRRWGTGLGAPDPTDPRAAKLAVIDGARDVQLLVVGDSRGQRLDPVRVARLTGRGAFNGAVSAGLVQTQLEVLQRVERHNSGLRAVVILSGVEAVKRDSASATGDRSAERLLSAVQLKQSARGLLDTAGLLDVSRPFRYRRDGFELASPLNYSPRGGAFAHGVPVLAREWDPPRADEGFADLQRLIITARSAGIRPVLVLMPYHAQAIAKNRGRFAAMRRRVHRRLDAIARRVPFQLVDFMQPAVAGVRSAGYADATHMDEENMSRLLARLLRAVPWLRAPRST